MHWPLPCPAYMPHHCLPWTNASECIPRPMQKWNTKHRLKHSCSTPSDCQGFWNLHGLWVGYRRVWVWVQIPVPVAYKTSSRTSKMDEIWQRYGQNSRKYCLAHISVIFGPFWAQKPIGLRVRVPVVRVWVGKKNPRVTHDNHYQHLTLMFVGRGSRRWIFRDLLRSSTLCGVNWPRFSIPHFSCIQWQATGGSDPVPASSTFLQLNP